MNHPNDYLWGKMRLSNLTHPTPSIKCKIYDSPYDLILKYNEWSYWLIWGIRDYQNLTHPSPYI